MDKCNINGHAALYVRLSKEDVDKENDTDLSQSIINQRLLLTDYSIENNFKIVEVYIDDDYSGLYDDRPEFDRLIRDSKTGKFDVVIAKSQSRFTRNMEHLEKYLHHDFVMLGIRFIGIVDGADTNVKGNKKTRQIYGLTNEWYSEDLSENIRAVFKHKMKAGQFIGSFAPYGYLRDPNDRHKFIIDEDAAETVRRIFHLYLQGYSAKSICHLLEDEGIPTPTQHKKHQRFTYENQKSIEFSQKYNFWSETTVKRFLRNETYIGKLIQGTQKKLSYKDKKVVSVPKEQWIVIDDHHAPIIDAETFYKVRSLLSSRRMVYPNQTGSKKVHVLAGKLRCKDCGSTLIKSGGVRGKDDWYMRCQLANKSRNRECTGHNITYSAIVCVILKSIKQLVDPILSNDKKSLSEYIESIIYSNDQLKHKEKQKNNLQNQLNDQTKVLKTLYSDRVTGIISDDMFFELKNTLELENTAIKEKVTKITEEIDKYKKEQDNLQNADELINKYCDFSRLTHEMVADFIDYVEVGERDKETNDQEVIIHWNF